MLRRGARCPRNGGPSPLLAYNARSGAAVAYERPTGDPTPPTRSQPSAAPAYHASLRSIFTLSSARRASLIPIADFASSTRSRSLDTVDERSSAPIAPVGPQVSHHMPAHRAAILTFAEI